MLDELLKKAKKAQPVLALSNGALRNQVILTMESLLATAEADILAANGQDMAEAQSADLPPAFLKRLALSHEKIDGLRRGLAVLRQLPDPLGQGRQWTLNQGLTLTTVHVPLGVIGLIFESRPGVTIEAAGLTLKSGNAIILRGGKEALRTNQALTQLWQKALEHCGLPVALVQLVTNPDRELAVEMMHLQGLDLLIPRGGSGLISTVVKEASVPVIETGVGNCHLYVDASADIDMALNILIDGKVGNPAVCNALETVLIHKSLKETFLPKAYQALSEYGVIWHADPDVAATIPQVILANANDWAKEYLSLDLAAHVVSDVDDALQHIAQYGTHHSEAIVANDYIVGQRFLAEVDAACVYWNASTRFSDGFQFGFGAEVGISTQKLHARGPMGLEALTTTKTIALGSGQTRDFPFR